MLHAWIHPRGEPCSAIKPCLNAKTCCPNARCSRASYATRLFFLGASRAARGHAAAEGLPARAAIALQLAPMSEAAASAGETLATRFCPREGRQLRKCAESAAANFEADMAGSKQMDSKTRHARSRNFSGRKRQSDSWVTEHKRNDDDSVRFMFVARMHENSLSGRSPAAACQPFASAAPREF